MQPTLIVITGPTGIGKTTIAYQLAQHLNTEIVSADSRQIYKELSIGTAVPENKMLKTITHHFIQNKSIHDYYNASMYEQEALALLDQLFKKYNHVVMVGGSMLYIDSLCNGIDDLPTVDPDIRNKMIVWYQREGLEPLLKKLEQVDPVHYNKVDTKNAKRVLHAIEIFEMTGKPYSSFLTKPKKQRPFHIIKIGLNTDRTKVYDRINLRVDQMVKDGLIEEARSVFPYRSLNALNTVGYKELFEYFDGHITEQDAITQIKGHTRKYARKQLTWFKKDEMVKWFAPSEESAIFDLIEDQI